MRWSRTITIAAVAMGLAPAVASAMPASTTFTDGGANGLVYTVPANVRLLLVEAVGASGGGPSDMAGHGALVQGVLPVAPGRSLFTSVGYTGPSGYLAGGGGGSIDGQHGGGGSGVRLCAPPTESTDAKDDCAGRHREPFLLVAAGGGGAGGGADKPAGCGVNPAAGDGGHDSTAAIRTSLGTIIPGRPGTSVDPSSPAGAGSAIGGTGGKAAPCTYNSQDYPASQAGGQGARAHGGFGADWRAGSLSSEAPPRYSGGGGGGGYYGGGGGSSGQGRTDCQWLLVTTTCDATLAGGGGGGGSSFIAAAGTLIQSLAADQAQAPHVTYTPLVAIQRPASGGRYRRGRTVKPRYECALDRCRAPHRLDTTTRGPRTFTITGFVHGMRVTARVAYRVVR